MLGLIGAGAMGSGIAQVFAAHDHDVAMVDLDEVALERGLANIGKSLGRFAIHRVGFQQPAAVTYSLPSEQAWEQRSRQP